jgi:hypothetical protein
MKESRFPTFAFGENRLRSTALNKPPPLVPLTRCGIPRALLRLRRNRTPSIACASLDLPNRGRRVAYGSDAPIDLDQGPFEKTYSSGRENPILSH